MATAIALSLNQKADITSPSVQYDHEESSERQTSIAMGTLHEQAIEWVNKLRPNLELLLQASQIDIFDPLAGLQQLRKRIDKDVLSAPRRKAADSNKAELAALIAPILYPGFPPGSLKPLIRYEEDIVLLRGLVNAQAQADREDVIAKNNSKRWEKRIARQGPWDPDLDPVSLEGAPAMPMPVKIADKDDLAPFFAHLKADGDDQPVEGAEAGEEPYYGTRMVEFKKGVLYSDGRMDLCKMVVGPPHIEDLMDSLESNTFTRHFLLGNNVIGPTGARSIARFVQKHPERIQTWYLAGNCINAASFRLLVDSFVQSPVITNVWLKRNPLGSDSAEQVFRLITESPHLRTLDLDQTGLGDASVAALFSRLVDYNSETSLALRNIYLNADGIGVAGCSQIARYLASSSCTLVSLYISNNPLGNQGAEALATGLRHNNTLERLSLQSCGISDRGFISLASSLTSHPKLTMLDIGQSYSTDDLGSRYNWLTDAAIEATKSFIIGSSRLQYVNLSWTAITQQGLDDLLTAVSRSSLLYYFAKSVLPHTRESQNLRRSQVSKRLQDEALKRLHDNVTKVYNGISYDDFMAAEKRWLVSPRDVRLIDSVYRNRDADMARRGLKVLEKWWEEPELRWTGHRLDVASSSEEVLA